ncbi:hypothetical protein GCM10025734_44790 [Kitasatospora paranensis]|uniref:hypothetical protein n=1 Tax=Kitasatospora paranensis TaxID=258053 RepID=UPI0031E58693
MPKIRQPDQPAPVFSAPKAKPQPPHHPGARQPGHPGGTGVPPHDRGPEGASAASAGRPVRRRRRVLLGALKATASLVALAAVVVGSWQAVEHLDKGDSAVADQPATHGSAAPPRAR